MNKFRFSISQVAWLLGKNVLTIKKWETDGLIDPLPRVGNTRSLSPDDLRDLALTARWVLYRIDDHRLEIIEKILGYLDDAIEHKEKK